MNWKSTFGLLCILLCLYACGQQSDDQNTKAEIALDVVPLKAQNVTVQQEYICEINATQFVEIHARVQGYLDEIYIDEGESVRKGQPLFRLSSNEYKAMVTTAEANLRRAIAEAKTKSLDVDRIRMMVEKGVISKTELELANALKDAAESGVLEAQSTLDNAKINLSYTFIQAPFDGIIDRIPFKKGSLINSGSLLTSISNIDEIYAYFRVSETEYLQFVANGHTTRKVNRPVTLELADGSSFPNEGFIETMEGDFDRSTGSIAFRARFKNPDKILKHGSSGKILMNKELRNAVLVPQKSAFTIQDKYYVYVLDKDNKARPKNFNTVDRYEDSFITNGLQQGDRVVIEGIQQLRDGTKVKPQTPSEDRVSLVN